MTENTKCNYCTLESMKRLAVEQGTEVIIGRDAGWTTARYSDEDEPSAWFLLLPAACVCGGWTER